MLTQVVKALDSPSHASLRLTTRAIHAASYFSVTEMVVCASCDNGLLWPAPSSLSLFPCLEKLTIALSDVPDRCPSNTPSAIVRQVLGVFPAGKQPPTLELHCTPVFSTQLSEALTAYRAPGHTVIHAEHICSIPVLRIPPLCSSPSPRRAITITAFAQTVESPGWAGQLASLTISQHGISFTANIEHDLLRYCDRAFLPVLAKLDIGFKGAWLDLAEDMAVNLDQLQELTLRNLVLGDRRLDGLAAAAPGLISLTIHSKKLLAVPSAEGTWDAMESLTLTVSGTVGHYNALQYSQSPVYFPGASELIFACIPSKHATLLWKSDVL